MDKEPFYYLITAFGLMHIGMGLLGYGDADFYEGGVIDLILCFMQFIIAGTYFMAIASVTRFDKHKLVNVGLFAAGLTNVIFSILIISKIEPMSSQIFGISHFVMGLMITILSVRLLRAEKEEDSRYIVTSEANP